MSEVSIAKILGGRIFSKRVVDESRHVDVVEGLEPGGQWCLSWIPVKSVSGVGNVDDNSKFSSRVTIEKSSWCGVHDL